MAKSTESQLSKSTAKRHMSLMLKQLFELIKEAVEAHEANDQKRN